MQEEKPKTNWLTAALLIIVIGLLLAIIFLQSKNRQASLQKSATPTSTSTSPYLKTESFGTGATATATAENSQDILNAARQTTESFMQARIERDLEQAKPYVSKNFLSKYDQGEFAGVSSPGLGNYKIESLNATGADTFEAKVTVYWTLNGDNAGSSDWTIKLIKSDDTALVDDYIQS